MDNKTIDPRKFLENFKQDGLTEPQTDQLMYTLFQEKGANEKKRILALHQTYQQQKRFRLRVLAYSAAAMLLCLVGFWQMRQSRKPNPAQLIALTETHAKTFIARESVLMGPQTDRAWESAYDAKEFSKTIEILEKIRLSDTTQFYLGLCYLQNTPAQPEKAIQTWGKIAKYRQDEIQWWVSLAYLRLGDNGRARKTLSTIQKEAYKYKDAQMLLKHIK